MHHNKFTLGFLTLTFAVCAFNTAHSADYNSQRSNQSFTQSGSTSDTDQTLTRKIYDKISSGLFSNGYEDVKVEVRNGFVTLSGYVETSNDKEKVANVIQNIEGVRGITNNVRIQAKSSDNSVRINDSVQNSDQDLAKKIYDKIRSGVFSSGYDNVKVESRNGFVTVTGAVETSRDKEKLGNEIQNIQGVKGVTNLVKIQPRSSDNSATINDSVQYSDQDLTKQIYDKIRSGLFFSGYDNVNVEVKNGFVTVNGYVQTSNDKEELGNEIQNIRGVRGITNNVKIQARNSENSVRVNDSGTSSDQELTKRIYGKIGSGMFLSGYDGVKADVRNGFVTLHGYVKTVNERQKVDNEVRGIEGVSGVTNKIEIRENASTYSQNRDSYRVNDSGLSSDQELTKRIYDKIRSGLFLSGYDGVKVDVKNGLVTLHGYVKTVNDRQKVDNEVRGIEGVNGVSNKLEIRDNGSSNSQDRDSYRVNDSRLSSDQELTKRIYDKIGSGMFLSGYDGVTVQVSNGVATLGGFVRSADEKEKVLNEVRSVEGVREVKNSIQVQ
ncbi:MAG: BON domain-containing protein [Parachlamydiaceae bacterium]|nr:BON domain-containing protein [Parachlamydiaceae bacterium]